MGHHTYSPQTMLDSTPASSSKTLPQSWTWSRPETSRVSLKGQSAVQKRLMEKSGKKKRLNSNVSKCAKPEKHSSRGTARLTCTETCAQTRSTLPVGHRLLRPDTKAQLLKKILSFIIIIIIIIITLYYFPYLKQHRLFGLTLKCGLFGVRASCQRERTWSLHNRPFEHTPVSAALLGRTSLSPQAFL